MKSCRICHFVIDYADEKLNDEYFQNLNDEIISQPINDKLLLDKFDSLCENKLMGLFQILKI